MLINKISAEEFDMINLLRHRAVEDTDFSSRNMVSDEQWLRYWEYEKTTSGLSKPFEDSLILKREIVCSVPDDALYDKMHKVVKSIDPLREKILNYLAQYNNTRSYAYGRTRDSLRDIFNLYVFDANAFINNSFDYETIEFNIGDNKKFKMNRGCKIMKILRKLAILVDSEAFFESNRLRQSQIMNDARIKATLCLSIHPIDYLTASLNENNWRSCMNWDDGEYRRGVIEMMNSPYVIVAYLTSNKEHLYIANDLRWNSKKWREFFIVHPNTISAIKGYPYWNRELEDTVLNWLRELYDDGSYASKIVTWQCDNSIVDKENNIDICFSFECGPAMYNDFYNDNTYHSIIRKNTRGRVEINYSGASECVICGSSNSAFDNESEVCCSDCITIYYCCSCGERISHDYNVIEFEDRYYCRYCYEELPACSFCGETVDLNNNCDAEEFVVAVKNEDDGIDDVISSYDSPIERVCCENCMNTIFRKPEFRNLMHNRTHHQYYHRYPVVYLDELTPDAQEVCIFDNYEQELRPLQLTW